MDQITETKQVSDALSAKSTTTTLDELRKKGKQQVKVIRATDIAAMITETVYRVMQDADNLSDEDRDAFVERSKAEFAKVVRVRRAEAAEHEARQDQLQTVTEELTRVNQELAEVRSGGAGQAPAGEAPSSDLLMRMMSEMADMKAQLANRPAAGDGGGGGGAGGGGGGDMAAALEKISASLDSRLDKMGRKMGISNAVEGSEVKYDSLFNDDAEANLESNMGDVQVKRKTGGGIAGNLERLKKLKGGG